MQGGAAFSECMIASPWGTGYQKSRPGACEAHVKGTTLTRPCVRGM